MGARSIFKFLLVTAILAVISFIAVKGIPNTGFKSVLDKDGGVKRGLDLVGGVVITYEVPANETVSDKDEATIKSILRRRLDERGHTEATVTKQGDRKFRIEIPAETDPKKVADELGVMAELKMTTSDNQEVLSGRKGDIKAASYQFDATKNSSYIKVEITKDAQARFKDATARMSGSEFTSTQKNYIAIKMDEKDVSTPSVKETIDSDVFQITGSFTVEEATKLANLINAGNLPYNLATVGLDSIGPVLGEEALRTSLLAGGVGLLLVMIFMIFFYRLPGLIASIALIGYTAMISILMMGLRGYVTLTLPGIAGIILSIGIAVDANVIIFERVKDELRSGKTLRSAIHAGFKRAMTAIIDSNVTTLIAAVVLYIFGIGPIKGFAITLGLGVLLSMFTAIVVTRFMLEQMIGMNIKNSKLYGA